MSVEREKLRDDLLAAVNARRELSQDDEQYLVEHFIDRLESNIDARIDAKVAQVRPQMAAKRHNDPWVVLAALGIAIPLSAIAAQSAGLLGLLVCWVGIVAVMGIYIGTRN